MKKIIIALFCLITLSVKAQTPTVQELIAKSSENLPEQSIVDKYPLLFATIKQLQNEEPKLKKIYYGRFNSNGAIKTTFVKGIIIFDIDYLERNNSDFDELSTWYFIRSVGVLNYTVGRDNPVPFEVNKSKYYYALNKIKTLGKDNCKLLKIAVNTTNNAALKSVDMNEKMAADEVVKSDEFKSVVLLKDNCLGIKHDDVPKKQEQTQVKSEPTPTNIVEPVKQNDSQRELAINEMFKKMKVRTDKITNKTFFYDKRTSYDNLYGEGLMASLLKSNDEYLLRMSVYHIPGANVIPSYITRILINAGGDPIELKGTPFQNVTTQITIDRTNTSFHYKLLKSICTNNKCDIRFYLANGRAVDYSLSNREIKEIRTVIEAFELLNKL
ncbi:MAG: hypothetical protein WCP65_00440 [Bacteroidota bacterium]